MADKEESIGALWIKEKNGKVFLTGKIHDVAVIAFQNTYKKAGSNQPDWKVFKARERGDGRPREPERQPQGRPLPMQDLARAQQEPEDDIPF